MVTAPRKKASVRLSGNFGTRYENEVAARFLVDMLAGTNSLGTEFGRIARVDWQARDQGWLGDDLAVRCNDGSADERSVGISIKSNQQITTNGFPRDFVDLAWAQWLQVPPARLFRRGKDAIALVSAEISLQVLSDWAALLQEILATTPDRIVARLNTNAKDGSQSSSIQRALAQSFACPDRYDQVPNPEHTIQLLHDVRVLVFDFSRSTSQAEVIALSDCQKLLESGDPAEARDLWERLVGIADEKRPTGGSLDLANLRAELRQRFSLRQHPDFTRDWQALSNLTADYKARVQTALPSGQSFARSEEKAKLQTAITASAITVVFGESGAGKSALLKDLLDERFADRTQVWLGPDELKTALSAARRSSLSLQHELGHILNVTANPRNILVLDSAERIEPAEFGVIGHLIKSLLPPEGQTEEATWQIVIVAQSQSWAESAEAILGGRRARLTEVELLKSSEVKAALQGSPSLSWLVGHDETIAQLTNLRVLAWVAQAGTALNTSANGLTSHTAIADRLWGYWTGGAADIQRLMMRLSEREASFERSFALTDIDSADSTTFARRPPQLPLRQNSQTNRIEFEHDLAADWARFQFLKQIAHDVPQWARLAEGPLWTNALRMLGQLLLRQLVGGKTAWDHAFETTETSNLRQANDVLLDAICLDPEAERFLSDRVDLLLANNAKHLTRLLTRFHHIGTVPTTGVWGTTSSLGLYLETQYRSVIFARWPPILRFLVSQRDKVGGLILSKTALIWLNGTPRTFSDGTPFPFRRQLTEIALSVARTVQVEKGTGIIYATRESEFYMAPLAGAADLPDDVANWALEMAGRQKIASDVDLRIGQALRQKAEAHAQRLTTDADYKKRHEKRRQISSGIGLGREKLPPWPLGANRRVDQDFRKAALTGNALTNLMRAKPDVAAEVLLALVIEDEPHREYGSERFEVELGLEFAADAYPTAFWKSSFFSFLQIEPQVALKALIALVNFCTERWLTEIMRGQEGAAPSVTLQLAEGQAKVFVGGSRVFDWTQTNSNKDGNLFCALDALERWLTLQIDTGADITSHLDQIFSESLSVACLGLLVNVGKYKPSLLSGQLAPLLSEPHVFYWDNWRVKNINEKFDSWSWARAGDTIFNFAKSWTLAAHRRRTLLDVAVELLKSDESVARRLKNFISGWTLPIDRKQALEFKLIFAELDRDNYERKLDPASDQEVLVLSYPEALQLEIQQWHESHAKPLQYLLLPSQLEKLIQEKRILGDEDAAQLFEVFQSCESDNEGDQDDRSRCQLAVAATLIVCCDAWLSKVPEAQDAVVAAAKATILDVGATSEAVLGRRIRSSNDELKFAAYAAMHIWIRSGTDSQEWESLVLRLLTSGDYRAASVIYQAAYLQRQVLGSTWWRLLQAGVLWSGLVLLSPEHDDDEHAKHAWDRWLERLRRFSLRREGASADDLKLARIAEGSERLRYNRRLRAYNSGTGEWRGKPVRRQGVDLDTQFLGVAFNWLVNGTGLNNWKEDAELVGKLWAYEAGRAKARSKEDREEYGLPSNPFGYDILIKLAALTLMAPTGKARIVWEPVLVHGPAAHYAVQHFFLGFFGLLSKGQDLDKFPVVWRDMAEYGLAADWNKKYGVWFYGLRILCDLLGFGREAALHSLPSSTALSMRDIYERWAASHLGQDEECVSRFCYFLASEFGTPLRLDGLRWIAAMFKLSTRSGKWYRDGTGDALIELLNTSLNQNASELASDTAARQALVELAADLADRGLPTALALQERIKLLR